MNKQLSHKHRSSINLSNDIQELMDEFFAFVNGDYDKVTIIQIYDIQEPEGIPNAEQVGKALYRLERCWVHRCMNLGLPGESQRLFKNKVKKRWMQLQKEKASCAMPTKQRKQSVKP